MLPVFCSSVLNAWHDHVMWSCFYHWSSLISDLFVWLSILQSFPCGVICAHVFSLTFIFHSGVCSTLWGERRLLQPRFVLSSSTSVCLCMISHFYRSLQVGMHQLFDLSMFFFPKLSMRSEFFPPITPRITFVDLQEGLLDYLCTPKKSPQEFVGINRAQLWWGIIIN